MFNPKYSWVLTDFWSVGHHLFLMIFWIGLLYFLLVYYHVIYVKYSIKDRYELVTDVFSDWFGLMSKILQYSGLCYYVSLSIFVFILVGSLDLFFYYQQIKFPRTRMIKDEQ